MSLLLGSQFLTFLCVRVRVLVQAVDRISQLLGTLVALPNPGAWKSAPAPDDKSIDERIKWILIKLKRGMYLATFDICDIVPGPMTSALTSASRLHFFDAFRRSLRMRMPSTIFMHATYYIFFLFSLFFFSSFFSIYFFFLFYFLFLIKKALIHVCTCMQRTTRTRGGTPSQSTWRPWWWRPGASTSTRASPTRYDFFCFLLYIFCHICCRSCVSVCCFFAFMLFLAAFTTCFEYSLYRLILFLLLVFFLLALLSFFDLFAIY